MNLFATPVISEIPFWEVLLRLASAAVLGGVLGIEREAHERPAGIRTYSLVALGAASFMLMALFIVEEWSGLEQVRLDLLRVVGGIIGGVGFLGAGAILRSRGNVKGLTTAAGIWLISAVGMGCGAGAYIIATTTVALAYIVLVLLHFLKLALNSAHRKQRGRKEDGHHPSQPGGS